jgi:hypothetical protein
MKTSSRRAKPPIIYLWQDGVFFRCLFLSGLVIRYNIIKTLVFCVYILLVCRQLDPGHIYDEHLVLALKLRVTEVVIRVVLTVGRKPKVDWTPLRTYSLQNYFSKF